MKRTILLLTLAFCFALGHAQKSCPHKMKDRDGNRYKTVLLGRQCWMAENLRAVTLSDGSPISFGAVEKSDEPRYYCPDNDCANREPYGCLYNWPAAMHACPKGWHLPSDAEWTQLTDFVNSRADYCCGGTEGANGKALA